MSGRPQPAPRDDGDSATVISKLVPVEMTVIDSVSVQTTNARDLHAFLKVGKDFSSWTKAQIVRARLVENKDYTCSPLRVSSSSGAKHTVEYHLTLEAGKHVAMLSETDKGFEVREYFIECERRALATLMAPALPNFADPAAAARAWADQVEARREAEAVKAQLEHRVAEQAPAVAAFDLIANAKGAQCITDAAKVLQLRPHELTDLLLARKWMYHRPGKPGYIAYQDKLDSGYLKHKLHNYQDPESGEYRAKEQVLVTKKGLTRLAELLAAEALARRVTAADQLQQRLPLPGDDG